MHSEIYGRAEQKRINSKLNEIDKLIVGNQKKALDFGAGTGNITGKLLRMGYTVVAVDISPEMCIILKSKFKNYLEDKRLRIINSEIEDLRCNEGEFDLITCYSVLHHLPDYVDVIRKLSAFLRRGGVMYLDHESSIYLVKPTYVERLARFLDFQFNSLVNPLFLKIKGVNVPSLKDLDFKLSDYWIFDGHSIDHMKIKSVFKAQNFSFFVRLDYHLKESWVFSPTFYIIKYFCRPRVSLWVAKK